MLRRKQNFNTETKQSGPKSEYGLNQARSGALLFTSLLKPGGFHKFCLEQRGWPVSQELQTAQSQNKKTDEKLKIKIIRNM